jgi:hypothetical protein
MTTNLNGYPVPDLPTNERSFPTECEFLVPLRMSFRHYREDGGVVPVSIESPETDMNQSSNGQMYAMSVMAPIVGHGTLVKPDEKDDGIMMVCDPVYSHLNANTMMNGMMTVYKDPLKWINTYSGTDAQPIRPPNEYMRRSSEVYRDHGPLSVYTNASVLEATNYSSSSVFWRSLYPPMEIISCHYTWPGIIEDNTIVSLGDMSGSDEMCEIESRKPKTYHDGFLDNYYTPQSKAAGRVRILAAGVTVRIMTTDTIIMANKIIGVLENQIGTGFGDWILRCGGFTTSVSKKDVYKMLNLWKNMCSFNMPTMHVFESAKVIVISIASGVLIRPVRLFVKENKFVMEGPMIDSMCVHHSDTMRFINSTFPDPEIEPEQYSCFVGRCIPCSSFATEPRTGLGIGMMSQALTTTPVKGDATIVTLGSSRPVRVTDFMSALLNMSKPECEIVVPGKSVVTAFINTQTNTEDACDIMREFAQSGTFSWMGVIDYPLPKSCGVIEPGTVLYDQPWWKPAMRGVVTRVYVNKNGGMNAITYLYRHDLEIGDKLVGWHGVKFTVGSLKSYKDMYTLENTITGEKFKPNMLVSTKTLARGPGGWIREMNMYTSAYESISAFRSMKKPTNKGSITVTEERRTRAELPEAYVTMDGERIRFRDTDGSMRTVKCNYGISWIMQVRHMPVLKQHYPTEPVMSLEVPRGRYRSGTPRMSETELLSMMMQNLHRNVSDAVQSSGFSDFTMCSVCHATYCDCPHPKPPTTTAAISYPALKLNEFATKAMMNDGKGDVLTLRFYTSDTN